jgi:hypothetical protein
MPPRVPEFRGKLLCLHPSVGWGPELPRVSRLGGLASPSLPSLEASSQAATCLGTWGGLPCLRVSPDPEADS